jgi:hypothetical protein
MWWGYQLAKAALLAVGFQAGSLARLFKVTPQVLIDFPLWRNACLLMAECLVGLGTGVKLFCWPGVETQQILG